MADHPVVQSIDEKLTWRHLVVRRRATVEECREHGWPDGTEVEVELTDEERRERFARLINA